MRAWWVGVCCVLVVVHAAVKPNPEFKGEVPPRKTLAIDDPEVRGALRFVMTELKRLSNQYRYATLVQCHGAEAGEANFDGRNLFLDVEFDMLKGQPSRHDIIVFKDESAVITGMAIDEFPEVHFRERPDRSAKMRTWEFTHQPAGYLHTLMGITARLAEVVNNSSERSDHLLCLLGAW